LEPLSPTVLDWFDEQQISRRIALLAVEDGGSDWDDFQQAEQAEAAGEPNEPNSSQQAEAAGSGHGPGPGVDKVKIQKRYYVHKNPKMPKI
jgi:hypothetical protein